MTRLFHLAYLGRRVRMVAGVEFFDDGLPAPSDDQMRSTYSAVKAAWDAEENRKIWPGAAEFLSEFNLEQLAAISLSQDPIVAALRLLLASWPAEIWSDDARIVMGLDRLVAVGVIGQAFRSKIVAKD